MFQANEQFWYVNGISDQCEIPLVMMVRIHITYNLHYNVEKNF